MCTISWLYENHGYQVFFNRDEQVSRAKAKPPEPFSCDHQKSTYLMPIDPQGLGSWMGVTQNGVTVCLLNFYQGIIPKGPLVSRGQLVKRLLEQSTLVRMLDTLSHVNVLSYAPFTLLLFSREQKAPYGVCWDGKTHLKRTEVKSPFTSSGIDFPSVSQHRQDSYQTLLKQHQGTITASLLFDFHRSHLPSKSMNSVCMHREDAQTVSLSHVSVEQDKVVYTYWDGPPCEQQTKVASALAQQ